MISPRKIFKNTGLLVHADDEPYGIFIYNDKGDKPGYKPWDKLRIVEVLYVEKKRRWFFATRRIRGVMKTKSVCHSMVGILDGLRGDFLEAIRQMEIANGRQISSGRNELSETGEGHVRSMDSAISRADEADEGRGDQGGVHQVAPPIKQRESDDEEIERLISGMKRGK